MYLDRPQRRPWTWQVHKQSVTLLGGGLEEGIKSLGVAMKVPKTLSKRVSTNSPRLKERSLWPRVSAEKFSGKLAKIPKTSTI